MSVAAKHLFSSTLVMAVLVARYMGPTVMIILQFNSIYMYKCTVHIQSWLARSQIYAQLRDSHSLFLLLSHICYFTGGKITNKNETIQKQLFDEPLLILASWLLGAHHVQKYS